MMQPEAFPPESRTGALLNFAHTDAVDSQSVQLNRQSPSRCPLLFSIDLEERARHVSECTIMQSRKLLRSMAI